MAQEAVIGAAPAKTMESRVDAMFAGDRLWAITVVAALWLTIFFVMLSVRPLIQNAAIETVCWIGAMALLLFNTASIVAMIRHYGQDKQHIYMVDIRHLDARR
jgi:hypothetical protein